MGPQVPTPRRFLNIFFSALAYLSPAARDPCMQLLPMYATSALERMLREGVRTGYLRKDLNPVIAARVLPGMLMFFLIDRKSTRLNSSHSQISYAVFCLKKKKEQRTR